MLGFSFRSAAGDRGIELMHRIRKGQFRLGKLRIKKTRRARVERGSHRVIRVYSRARSLAPTSSICTRSREEGRSLIQPPLPPDEGPLEALAPPPRGCYLRSGYALRPSPPRRRILHPDCRAILIILIVAPQLSATRPAILFSKPSPAALEKGRLFGSAQTLNGNSSDCADRALRAVARATADKTRTRCADASRPRASFTWSPSPNAAQSRREAARRSRVPYPCTKGGQSRRRSFCRARGRR